MTLEQSKQLEEYIRHNLKCSDILEFSGIKKKGRCYKCPWHKNGEENRASLRYYPSTNTVYCWTCGQKHDVFDVIGQTQGIDSFLEQKQFAIDYMGGLASIGNVADYEPPKPKPIKPLSELKDNTNLYKYYQKILFADSRAMEYLHNRGLTDATIKYHRLGYQDRAQRIVIPISRYFYTARYIGMETDRPKYKDNFQGDGHKHGIHSIFGGGIISKLPEHSILFITEGAFDSMILHQIGEQSIALNSLAQIERFVEILQLDEFKSKHFNLVYFADNNSSNPNNPGAKGGEIIEQKMIEYGYKPHVITTQETDVNEEYLNNRGHLIELIASVKNEIERESNNE